MSPKPRKHLAADVVASKSAPRKKEAAEGEKGRRSLPDKSPPTTILGRHSWTIPVVLAVASSISTLWNGFATDDQQQVLNNAFIKSISNLPLAFTSSVWSFATQDIIIVADSYYRPLFMALFAINHALFGESPWGWHLTNVLIHAAVTGLVFVVLKESSGRPSLAVIAATLFSVHPVHAESVAWISGVTDPMMMVFALLAFYTYLRFRRSDQKLMILASLLLYLLALLCKETALALVLIIAYWELVHVGSSLNVRRRVVRSFGLTALFLAPTLIYFLLRSSALSSFLLSSESRYPLVPALLTIPLALAKYIGLMLIPVDYSYQHYTEVVSKATSAEFILPVALSVVIVAAVLGSRSRLLFLASFWFIATLAPALAVLRQFDPEFLIQERYLYMPSLGFCLAASLGIERLCELRPFAPRKKAAIIGLTSAIILVWGAAYIRHSRTWDDTTSVFENCVAVAPDSALARTYLARTYCETGRLKSAEDEMQKALALDPQCPGAYLTASYLSHRQGSLDKAIEYLERATEMIGESPLTRFSRATIYLNLGLLYEQRKNSRAAEDSLLKSIAIWQRAVGYYYAGQFYFDHRRYEEALAMFGEARKLVPRSYAMIHLKMGQVYEKLNQPVEARGAYEKYLNLSPRDAQERDAVVRRLGQL